VKNLITCFKKQNWRPHRILFCSSLAACGPSLEAIPLTENDEPQPIDDYGRAKLEAEKFLLSQNDVPVTIFRPCTVIGPMDENVFNLYKLAKRGFGFKVYGLNQKLSFIAVSDLVNAVCKLSEDKTSQHKIYFISHDDTTDVLGLWHEVEKTLGKKIRLISLPKPLLYIVMILNTALANIFQLKNSFDKKYHDQMSAQAWLCSSKKLQNDFNWKPNVSLEEVFKETAESYRNAGWL
jgi:nucleoside-diphosphate-sugar epimerase